MLIRITCNILNIRELVSTIGWAKQVPGFTELTLNDQMKLLQTTWTEVLTLSLLFRSLPKNGKLNFAPDLAINQCEAAACGLELFYEKCMILIDKLEFLGLCKEEFLILKVCDKNNVNILRIGIIFNNSGRCSCK